MAHGLRRTAFDQSSYAYWTGKYGIVNVKDYGAVGDGVHDDTAAIQKAIDAVQGNFGGTVTLPPGQYRISTALVMNSRNVILQGSGMGGGTLAGTIIQPSTPDQDVILNESGSTGCQIRDLVIQPISGLVMTGGAGIHINGASRVVLYNLMILSTYNGVYAENFQTIKLLIVNCSNLTGEYGFYISGPNGPASSGFYGYDLNCGGNTNAINFMITGNVATVRLLSCGSEHGVNSLKITGGVGVNPQYIYAYDFECENADADGIVIDAGNNIFMSGFETAAHGNNGINVTSNAGRHINFTNGIAGSNGYHGVLLGGGADINISSIFANENSQAAALTYDGVHIAAGGSQFTLNNNQCRDTLGVNGKQNWGIYIEDGSSDYFQITNNMVYPNAGNDLYNGASGVHPIIVNNLGYNPLGSISPPASPLVSGTVYQNTSGSPFAIYQPAYATTAGTAGSVAVALGGSSTPSTIFTQWVNGSTTSSLPEVIQLRVPPGWYYSFTTTGATLANAQIQGE